ncbi:MAG: phospholipase D-like domain-containing protein [Candidatus Kaiserbacteria bacterium]|nr:phospholipase D-like domain-containing protein [Candidatus Kaiserbacteria bacterium]
MKTKIIRASVALVLVLAAGGAGYGLGSGNTAAQIANIDIPAQTVSAPPAGSLRVVYSLDQKQNDKEIIALIDAATSHIYFAIYTFTLPSIADALVAAKERGIDVRGIVDSEQSSNSYGAPITEKLLAAGISVVTEKHATGNGIMHIKAIVTDSAYALGSYNWTNSATTINDEILEIGTDPTLRQVYENILKRLLDAYKGNSAAAGAAAHVSIGTIDYTNAPAHIGDYASVRGTLVDAYTSASGTVFLDFCKSYKTCPFSGVIFADDVKKFGDLSRYAGQTVTLTGKISSYQDKAEIVLSDPSQLSK